MGDPFLVRNVVYGFEDSLVSTAGLVIGISLAGLRNADVVKSGLILVLVESLSMAFGSFISEDSFVLESGLQKGVVKYAFVMFAAYAVAGMVPLLPFFLGVEHAWVYSLVLTLVAFFGLMVAYQRRSPKNTRQRMTKAGLLTLIASAILAVSTMAGLALKGR